MNKQLRKAVIAGNWKMNKTPAETTALINEMKPLVKDADCDVVLCVPFIDIAAATEAAKGSNIKIGAENVHFKASGAYTGEISAEMLLASGVEYVVIGHSERRQYFGETDQTVNLRTLAAVNAPVWAIGTGVTATADQADEGNGFVREAIAEVYGKDVAETVTIQYGGSMNAKNADELVAKYHVDGGLIGGASLKAEDFSVIVKAASK